MEKKEITDPKTKKEPLHTVTPIIAEARIMQEQSKNGVPSDVNGSYTGTPIDGGVPEQDVDDL